MSVGDSGAFNASAISCAFWLTLPFLVRIVRIASLKLFCLPCFVEDPCAAPFAYPNRASFLGCHLSAGIVLPFCCGAWEGLAVRDELWPYSSSGIGMRSGWKAGNLNV
jgi:hypothetical protein